MFLKLQRLIESRTSLRGARELSGYNLVMIFVFMSVVGLIGESFVSLIQDGVWKDRAGLLWGPFSPIYGLGAMVFTIVLNEIHDKSPLLLFLVAAVFGGLTEYLGGYLLENWYGIVAWSYLSHPFNFSGFTSVPMCIIWGALGLAWIRLALAPVMRIIDLIPLRLRKPLYCAFCIIMVVDIAMTIAAWEFWFQRMSGAVPATPLAEFYATYFDDQFMANRFQTMSMWPEIATWR